MLISPNNPKGPYRESIPMTLPFINSYNWEIKLTELVKLAMDYMALISSAYRELHTRRLENMKPELQPKFKLSRPTQSTQSQSLVNSLKIIYKGISKK